MTARGAKAAGAVDTAGPLSHVDRWRAGIVQAVSPPSVVDLGPGYLDPALLPVDLLADGYARALAEFGAAALSYGDDQGVVALRELLAARIHEADGVPCGPDQVVITSGTSQALYLIATALAERGQIAVVQQTSYDFGRKVLTDCGLRTTAVAADGSGMIPEALDEVLGACRSTGATPALVYLNPTFHNPSGAVAPVARRRALLAVAHQHGVLVVEDDPYVELALDGRPVPCSMAGLAGYEGVVRLGSFSKTAGPGLRLGYLVASSALAARLVGLGVFVSGGGLNHLGSLAMTVLIRDGDYDRHLGWLRDRLRERRDALVTALRRTADPRTLFSTPAGGFFVWLEAPAADEANLLDAADRAGVRVAAGSRFGRTSSPAVRLAYSFNSPHRLATAVGALARAIGPVLAGTPEGRNRP